MLCDITGFSSYRTQGRLNRGPYALVWCLVVLAIGLVSMGGMMVIGGSMFRSGTDSSGSRFKDDDFFKDSPFKDSRFKDHSSSMMRLAFLNKLFTVGTTH